MLDGDYSTGVHVQVSVCKSITGLHWVPMNGVGIIVRSPS